MHSKPEVFFVVESQNPHVRRFKEELSKTFSVKLIESKAFDSKGQQVSTEHLVGVIYSPLTVEIPSFLMSLNCPLIGISLAFDLMSDLNTTSQNKSLTQNLGKSSIIIVDCQYSKNLLRHKFLFKKRIAILAYGCDFDYFSQIPIESIHNLNILVTRNWTEIHRNQDIFEAFKVLQNQQSEFRATFVGDGPEKRKLVADYSKIISDAHIRILINQNASGLFELMRSHQIYVSAASSDGASVSLLEAMSAGMLCVVTDFDSNIELIENEKNGLIFENRNSLSLAATLLKISELSVDQLKLMRTRARQTASLFGDWKINGAKLNKEISDAVL
jgi:glycosyltransferase involved in cell wall biosynthesis